MNESKAINLRPFLGALLAWGIIGGGTTFAVSATPSRALGVFGIMGFLGVLDLFFILKTVAAVMHLMSDQGAKNRTGYAIQTLLYGSGKVMCLLLIGLGLWKVPKGMIAGTVLGISTLVAVPLLGSVFWVVTGGDKKEI